MFQTTLLKEILQKQYLITYRNFRKHQIFSVIYRQIKLTFFERIYSKFQHENFILDYFVMDWPEVLKLDRQNGDILFNNFYEAISTVLDKHTSH